MDNITIDFKYKPFNSEEWFIKHMTVEEYFDLALLEENEKLTINSIPLHDNFIDYFDCERKTIHQISIDIVDTVNDCKLHFLQSFWNEQKNWLVVCVDTIGDVEEYRELIISTELPVAIDKGAELSYEIMRFSIKERDINCLYHVIGFIHNNQGGCQDDILIEPKK